MLRIFRSGQSDHFVVHDRWKLEAHGSAALLEWQRAPGAQRANALDSLSGSHIELHLLRADGVEATQETARHVRVVVVQDVQGIARLGLPGEDFRHAFTRDRHRLAFVAKRPADGVLDQLAEIGIARAPEGAVNVAGEKGYARIP